MRFVWDPEPEECHKTLQSNCGNRGGGGKDPPEQKGYGGLGLGWGHKTKFGHKSAKVQEHVYQCGHRRVKKRGGKNSPKRNSSSGVYSVGGGKSTKKLAQGWVLGGQEAENLGGYSKASEIVSERVPLSHMVIVRKGGGAGRSVF